MAVLPTKQPTNRSDPMPTKPERGDAMPSLVAGDNNRGYHDPLQTKGKIFQSPEEIYNNPVKSNHGAIYSSGTNVQGIPDYYDNIVNEGPFAY